MLTPLLLAFIACNAPPSEEDLARTRGGRVDVFFNDPGTRPTNLWKPDAVKVMVDLIDQTRSTLDLAVMGFSYKPVVDAFVRASARGVQIRMVGDAGHVYNSGYQALYAAHVPMQVGNSNHIMHDKFFVSDGRFVFASTANWSTSDLTMNINNFVVIDSPPVAQDFTIEFEQMYEGVFGHNKVENDTPRVYQVGDTELEVWFSPHEDGLGRMLELIDGAKDTVRFTIFAMTKDQVGSGLVRKQSEFDAKNQAEGLDPNADIDAKYGVAGLIDQSQLHSNGQYHEAYRMLGAGLDLRLDANDNSEQPGDYQAGGGRLHAKTMVFDARGEDPVLLTGSFNWSAAATQANDEFLLVMRGERVTQTYDTAFRYFWDSGRQMGNTFVGEDIEAGDVIVNEVMWYGVNDSDPDGFDQFIELRNLTDRDLDLSMWQIRNEFDVVVGFPPGTRIKANDTFLILDHTLEPYQDGAPQDTVTAFTNGDLVLNAFNDNRQARLYLKGGNLELRLLDPRANVVDRVGDGGAAFAGGPRSNKAYSMERRANPGDGADPASWYACTAEEGGANVNADYKRDVIATPGEPNSPE